MPAPEVGPRLPPRPAAPGRGQGTTAPREGGAHMAALAAGGRPAPRPALDRRGVGGVALPAGAGVLTALAACGRGGEGDAGTAPPPAAAPERIVWSTFRGGAENGRWREMQIERFQTRFPRTRVDLQTLTRDYPKQYTLAAAGSLGDVYAWDPSTGSSSRPSGGASCARSTSTSSGTSSTWASSTSSSSRSSGRTAGCTACRAGAGRGRTDSCSTSPCSSRPASRCRTTARPSGRGRPSTTRWSSSTPTSRPTTASG